MPSNAGGLILERRRATNSARDVAELGEASKRASISKPIFHQRLATGPVLGKLVRRIG
jgi:hypothetical protein